MDYREAIEYINDKNKFGTKLGLDSIARLLDLLGNPHKGLKYIHVAGTNGKGSTSSFISSALEEGGYKVGLFTSPFLERFNERIKINGNDIPDKKVGELTLRIKEKCNQMLDEGLDHPTTFEIVTVLAFLYFAEEKTDYVVLEVGLGGRYDSTNIITDEDSIASVITSISYDHLDVLGDNLAEIAYEKAGIIKKDSLLISYSQEAEVIEVLKDIAFEKKSKFNILEMETIKIKEEDDKGTRFDFQYKGYNIKDIKISMLGKHQVYNACLAMASLLELKEKNTIKIGIEEIKKGLLVTNWPGRLEILKRDPMFLIDGAHNVQAIEKLVDTIGIFDYDNLILGLGILKDKETEKMVEIIAPEAEQIIITEVNMPRKYKAEELAKEVSAYNKKISIEKDIEKAIGKAYQIAGKNDLIIFCGSLYLIGEVRKIIKNLW